MEIVDLIASHSISFHEAAADTWVNIGTELSNLKSLTEIINSQKILELVRSYIKYSGKKEDKIGANLCSKFLNIRGLTFIEKLDKLETLMFNAVAKVSNYKSPQGF